MDDFTRRRHENKPDYVVDITATGVKLPDGTIGWRMTMTIPPEVSKANPEIHKPLWWARVLTDWASEFIKKVS